MTPMDPTQVALHLDAPFTRVDLAVPDQEASSETVVVAVGLGQPSMFRPAGLPVPAWCVVVNPMNEQDDPDFEESQLSEAFESYNQDASLTVLEGASLEELARALWALAIDDATSHLECYNGGAYALWVLPEGRIAVGGFDNGGSDMASFGCEELAPRHGTVVGRLQDAHFQPEEFIKPERGEDPAECAALHLVLAAEPSSKSTG